MPPATLALMPPSSFDHAEAFIEIRTCRAVLIVVLDTLDERAFEVTACGVEFPDHPARFHQQHAVGDSGQFVEVVVADQDCCSRLCTSHQ